jgi:glycerol-3-phosphate cytidylyltransferase
MRVLADGCFDPLHYGHVRYLVAAAACGPPLIVRVAPDSAITAKGRTPFQSQDERARTVLAIGVVDRIATHETLALAVLDVHPKYLVKGEEWRGKLPEDVLTACQAIGTEIIYTDTQERSSSERLAG